MTIPPLDFPGLICASESAPREFVIEVDPKDQLFSFNDSDPHDLGAETCAKIVALHKKWPGAVQ
jgi:hypothetical protein